MIKEIVKLVIDIILILFALYGLASFLVDYQFVDIEENINNITKITYSGGEIMPEEIEYNEQLRYYVKNGKYYDMDDHTLLDAREIEARQKMGMRMSPSQEEIDKGEY